MFKPHKAQRRAMAMPANTLQKSKSFATLIECLDQIDDPRIEKKTKYSLTSIVLMALCASLGGANNWVEIEQFCRDHAAWFSKKMMIRCGIPAHDTFNRVFNFLNPKQLTDCLVIWMESCFRRDSPANLIHVDGKVLKAYASDNPLTLVRAWSQELNCVIGSIKVDVGSNEITAIPSLLESLYLKGKIVTIDAIGAQKNIVAKVAQKKGDYVIALKGNQKLFHEDIALFMQDIMAKNFNVQTSIAETIDKNRGRIEKRKCYTTSYLPWLSNAKKWKKLQSITAVETVVSSTKTGIISRGIRYFISSLPAQADRILPIVRNHWSIENKLHWPADRYFDEDRSTVRDSYGAQNFSFLRTVAIAVLQQYQKRRPGRGIATLRQIVNRKPNILVSVLLN